MARIVICQTCNLDWNISKLQKIPSKGYECPWCFSKRKALAKPGKTKASA